MKLGSIFFGLCVWVAAKALIDRRMAEVEAQVRRGEPADGIYLTYLLSSDKLSQAEVYITVTELLLGGVDTVRSVGTGFVIWFSFLPADASAGFTSCDIVCCLNLKQEAMSQCLMISNDIFYILGFNSETYLLPQKAVQVILILKYAFSMSVTHL